MDAAPDLASGNPDAPDWCKSDRCWCKMNLAKILYTFLAIETLYTTPVAANLILKE